MNTQVTAALRKLYLGRRTGVLLCEGADAKRSVTFREGLVIGARSSLIDDRLGEVMMRHGRITRQQFEDAARFIKSGWKLGEILVELRVIQKDEIERFVRIQLLDIVCSLIIHPPIRIVFTDAETVESTVSHPVSVADAVVEAARRSARIDDQLKTLLSRERPLSLARDPALRLQDVTLSPEEGFILSRVDGSQSPKSIASMSPLSEKETARTLLGLLEAGILEEAGPMQESANEPSGPTKRSPEESVPPPPGPSQPLEVAVDAQASAKREVENLYQQCQGQDHWQVLEVERGASKEEMTAAFRRKTSLYHPDRYHHIRDRDFQEKLSHLFHRIREAYETLSTEENAKGYDQLTRKERQYEKQNKKWSAPPKEETKEPRPARSEKEGKALFAQAKNSYLRGDYWMTIQLCQQAIEIVSDDAGLYHLLAMAQEENPKWRKDAERNLQIAIKLDPWKPEYLVSLGKLYRAGGLHSRAEKVFEQVRVLDPSFPIPE